MGGVKTRTSKEIRAKAPALDEATFHNLRRRITNASGIYVLDDANSRFLLERRLSPRLRVRGVTSFSDYETTLDEKELDTMLDVIAVHETYFFREKRQLKVFSDHIIPELSRLSRPVKIWSAGCSTGEEAYTIAMLLAEQDFLGEGRAQVIASDLSMRVIKSGIQGIYGASSFRTTEPRFKEKYFTEAGRGLWRASDLLRSSVQFEQANLIGISSQMKECASPADGGLDVIFCRNVLMYFDEAAVKKTLTALHSLLREGGYLLLGHAESLL
ncbi:MAG TPA: protein-glutamate O-methyltransferase CheR, partial [Blastocatellia bacterium]